MTAEGLDRSATETFDEIAADLQTLREQAGPVSYAEIVRRVTELRLARGVHEAAAAPPRSTVYNAFSEGRARLDTELVRDIVVALGADEAEADAWVARCRRARRVPAGGVRERIDTGLTQVVATVQRVPLGATLMVLVLCLAGNLLGSVIVHVLGLPIFLDMAGTAIAAIALGPWSGVAVAIATSAFGVIVDQHDYLFALAGIAGALIWGYGVRKFRMGDTFVRFFLLGLIVAAVCSLIAVPILLLRHGGSFGAGQTGATNTLLGYGLPLVWAVTIVNVITSLIDKLLTSYIALVSLPLARYWFSMPIDHVPLVGRIFPARPEGAPGDGAPGDGAGGGADSD
ncbi:energy-coupling factor transport system substrate-specific component [Leucobacter komagatae]|uniref:Energy-coupling factor transport system substrate-specific component n=1 Tax=Leucobacter komagatae TaxID=55969 RepID=A0A542XY58_9MICO|nr:hypothetical protein [Leucobacter komagatae]TQL40748.1 energy-coupling factor transport system substrate-specific component [Leucobacter komagatae]